MITGQGTWIPNSDTDTRWGIFKKLFKVRVSNIQTMSHDYLKLHGMLDSGDPYQNQQQAHELIDRMVPISEMIKMYNNGVIIRIVRYSDTKEIYELISNHLNYWKRQLETGFHIRNAPIDDLILMDKFAVHVYDHAKYQFTTEMVDSILARRASETMKATRTSILKPPKRIVINEAKKEEEVDSLPKRESLADAFINHRNSTLGMKKWST